MVQQVVRGPVVARGVRGPTWHRAPARRAAVAAVLATLLAALAAPLVAAPAAAHDQLVASDPADGAVLTAIPSQVTLTFSAEPLAGVGGAAVVVTGPDGASWSEGEPAVEGTTVTQALRPGMPTGAWTVAWRAPSSDGHVLEGTFGFTLDVPAAAPTAGPTTAPTGEPVTPTEAPSAEPAPEPSDAAATDEPDVEVDPLPWLWAGVVVVALGGLALAVALRRRGGGA
ncbi:copper resistance CopC family protein [Actinotalea solisilvae]|uniref:copper resistance CopC family protein n=1 Tax=Actinotalea solisilvae TaxID=2072922 RepID=UPI0018F1CA30|nr:copper resistance CopC family protein [Actinotalea solisilvae]